MPKKYIYSIIFYLLFLVFVANDAWIYKTPVAKITHVTEKKISEMPSVRGGKEIYYLQNLKAKILNGSQKGKILTIRNEYTTSRIIDQKYHKEITFY